MDRRLICEHVRKPLYGPGPLILDRTTSAVEANSLRHPQGDAAIPTVFGRKETARRTDACVCVRVRVCAYTHSYTYNNNLDTNLLVLSRFPTLRTQWRMLGGFEGFDRTTPPPPPPLAGESLCTTTPPLSNIITNCFSSVGHLFQLQLFPSCFASP